jgi:hypothetical protein
MKIRAVPVGCMPRGRYGSRIGLIRRTENPIQNFVSFLYLTVYYYATLFLSVHNFISNHSRRCALVFPKRNGLSRQCFVSCRYYNKYVGILQKGIFQRNSMDLYLGWRKYLTKKTMILVNMQILLKTQLINKNIFFYYLLNCTKICKHLLLWK